MASLSASEGAGGPSSSTPAQQHTSAPIRSEMVAAAKQFLANPRVRTTPLNEQTEFLRGKGLTEAEIQRAMQSTELAMTETTNEGGREQMASTSALLPPLPSPPLPSSARAIVDLARSALVFGTVGYMVYRFVRSWMLPQLLNVADPAEERMQRIEQQVERLSESTRCIAESVTQTLVAVTEQNEQLSRTMMMAQGGSKGGAADMNRIHAEIGIVKSLLLNQNQFPPVPESAFPRPRRAVQNGQNSIVISNTKNKRQMCPEKEEENGEEKNSNGEDEAQPRQRELLGGSDKNGSPV